MDAHLDIRWNPELQEWFCARCGATSDHTAKEDAIHEMKTFDCSILGTNATKVEKERLLRVHYLNKGRKSDK